MLPKLKNIFVLSLGFIIGILLQVKYTEKHYIPVKLPNVTVEADYARWLKTNNIVRRFISNEEISFGNRTKVYTELNLLGDRVSVFCAIITKRKQSSYAVANTWSKKCTHLKFFAQEPVKYIDTVVAKHKSPWHSLCVMLRYVWTNYSEDLQWVLVAYDDLFVILENLRYFLAPLNFNEAFYFGHNSQFMGHFYNDASAGYVLSKEAIRLLLTTYSSIDACLSSKQYFKSEAIFLGQELLRHGVHVSDTRDKEGRHRFHLFTPQQLMAPGHEDVLSKYSSRSVYKVVQGQNCCSSTTISFQVPDDDLVYFYLYVIYHVKVFNYGHLGNLNKTFAARASNEVWQRFVKEEFPEVDLNLVDPELYEKLWTIKEKSPEEFNSKLRSTVLKQSGSKHL